MPIVILHSNPVRILALTSGELLVKSQNLRTWNQNISRYRFLELSEGRCGAKIYEFNNDRYAEGSDNGFYIVGNPVNFLQNGSAGVSNLVELQQPRVQVILEALERADELAGNKVIQDNPR
jgi:hypothetical protein